MKKTEDVYKRRNEAWTRMTSLTKKERKKNYGLLYWGMNPLFPLVNKFRYDMNEKAFRKKCTGAC